MAQQQVPCWFLTVSIRKIRHDRMPEQLITTISSILAQTSTSPLVNMSHGYSSIHLNVRKRDYPGGFWISRAEVCKSFMSRNITNIDSSWLTEVWSITMYLAQERLFLLPETYIRLRFLKCLALVKQISSTISAYQLSWICLGSGKTSKLVFPPNSASAMFCRFVLITSRINLMSVLSTFVSLILLRTHTLLNIVFPRW